MAVEMILAPATLLIVQNSGQPVYINDTNANEFGIEMKDIRKEFLSKAGREILTNENVKMRFDSEGQNWDFSTFDGISVRVQFSVQRTAPNKSDF